MNRPRHQRQAPQSRVSRRPLLATIVVFALSRIGYYLAGVRFDASSLPWFWQYIDPELLRTDFLRSIWHLHSQPPLMNALLGVATNLFPGRETVFFVPAFLLFGLTLTASLYLLIHRLGIPGWWSAAIAALYAVSPACVLYENWLFYTYPVAVMLVLAALFFSRFVSGGRTRDAAALFGISAALALTWSLFHIAWLALLVLVTALVRRDRWRRIAAAAAVPLIIVAFWYGKNLAQVGQFTSSTWFGMNFSKMTNSMLTVPERRALSDEGEISAVSMVPPFSNPDRYRPAVPAPLPTGIPVLDQEMKPSGIPNFNNLGYVEISRLYGRDAMRILEKRPAAYLRGIAESFLIYFLPSSAYLFLRENLTRVAPVDRFFTIAFNGRFFHRHDRDLRQADATRYYLQGLLNTGWFIVLCYLAALVAGVFLLLRAPPSAGRSTLLFVWFNIAWITLVANALEVGENNRFRFVTDPLVVAMLVALVASAAAGLRRRFLTAPRRRAS